MPIEMGLPKYFNFAETKVGTQLVHKGEYIGETTSKYGANHNFMELDTNQLVTISGGQINWQVKEGRMKEGEVFDIYYEGKEKMTKGDYAGKDANQFKFCKYKDHELPENKRGGKSVPTAVPQGNPVEALDDLA